MQTLEAETLRRPMPAKPEWLRANAQGAVGVDRANKAILGYVVAQEGAFLEPDPRGEFDEKALKQIVKLMKLNKNGTKIRLGHPSLSDDGISKYMGRAKNPRLDRVTVNRDGQQVELMAVRADAYLSETAFEGNPNGNLGEYMLARAEEDPDSLSSSLVLQVDEEYRLEKNGTRKLGDDGKPLPPLWRPLSIHASDFVDQGAAVNGLLSADALAGLPDAIVRQGCQLLDAQFAGQTRNVVQARLNAFVVRYLGYRFGSDGDEAEGFATEVEPESISVAQADAPDEIEGTTDEALLLDLWLMENDSQ